ncbi:MAG: dTDP-4-dehydrorhamnose reductase [Paludibacteraceae bacterium]|nr:dTDP-4-dehydrorhamnose reductase [Paludibacteraceae bacterium]
MTILITGCNGQLGTEMRLLSEQHTEHRYIFTDVAELDITDFNAILTLIQKEKVEAVVNCAAYTNVDKAEQDEPTALLLNATAVENLGKAASLTGAKLIHISTDYVFDGKHYLPYKETDPTCPQTAYGRTKLEGEKRLLQVCPDAVIIRTAWLYSPFGNNFVKTMLRLGKERTELRVIFDQIGTPTYARDLAKAIYTVINAKQWHSGIYHFSNEGVCSWYDFTSEILRQANINTCKVTHIHTCEYPTPTPRPHFSVLDKQKIKDTFGIVIPQWQQSLQHCLQRLIQ